MKKSRYHISVAMKMVTRRAMVRVIVKGHNDGYAMGFEDGMDKMPEMGG